MSGIKESQSNSSEAMIVDSSSSDGEETLVSFVPLKRDTPTSVRNNNMKDDSVGLSLTSSNVESSRHSMSQAAECSGGSPYPVDGTSAGGPKQKKGPNSSAKAVVCDVASQDGLSPRGPVRKPVCSEVKELEHLRELHVTSPVPSHDPISGASSVNKSQDLTVVSSVVTEAKTKNLKNCESVASTGTECVSTGVVSPTHSESHTNSEAQTATSPVHECVQSINSSPESATQSEETISPKSHKAKQTSQEWARLVSFHLNF